MVKTKRNTNSILVCDCESAMMNVNIFLEIEVREFRGYDIT